MNFRASFSSRLSKSTGFKSNRNSRKAKLRLQKPSTIAILFHYGLFLEIMGGKIFSHLLILIVNYIIDYRMKFYLALFIDTRNIFSCIASNREFNESVFSPSNAVDIRHFFYYGQIFEIMGGINFS